MKRNLLRLLRFLIWTFVATLPQVSVAGDPSIRWEKIETPNFTVIFDSSHRPLGEMYARFAEESFLAIAPTFGVWPRKTVLIIDDSTDLANGFATGVPYPLITAFPVLPGPLDSIGDFGNWGRELVLHEYVHILNFEPATGLMRPFRWTFGSIVRPNLLLPRWYSEGLAVQLETRHSDHGRLRSPNFLAIIRAMSEEGTLRTEDIARINESSIPDWPGGMRPYLMGSLLWNELVRLGGEGIIQDLNLAYSRRIPYFIDGPVESRLGLDYQSLLDRAYDRFETNSRTQIAAVRTQTVPIERKLHQEGFFSHSPVISPDGSKLIFLGKKINSDGYLALLERENGTFADAKEARQVLSLEGMTRASWLPDSKTIVYDALDTAARYTRYSDIWSIDLPSRKRTRITRGLRAREPVSTPDGSAVVFVQNVPGGTQLALVRLDGSGYQVLYAPQLQTRISRPEFISADTLVFAERTSEGAEGFKAVTLAKSAEGDYTALGEPTEVLKDWQPVHFPRMTKDGLLFVSDRSGVPNLYLANETLENARAVTNTTTRVLTGDLDPQTGDLIYSRLQAVGPQIFSSARDEWQKVPADPPKVLPLVDGEWPKYAMPELGEGTTQYAAEEYRALPYMLPRYWMPIGYLIPGGLYLQATTSTQDPIGRHAYSLSVGYDTLTNYPSFLGQYVNQTTPVTYTLTGENINEYIYSSAIRRESTAASLTGSFRLPQLGTEWRSSLGLRFLRTQLFGQDIQRSGATATLSWASASQRGTEISPTSGGSATLSYTHFARQLSSLSYDQIDLRSAYYFSRWLPERHALAFFANATYAPRLTSSLLGRSTVGGNYQTGLVQSSFVMRGYGSGVFLGRNIASTTAEYRFPILDTYAGFGTKPVFIRRLHGTIFVDGLTLDGLAYNFQQRKYESQKLGAFYLGTGAELKLDLTAFYHAPLQLIFGAYYGTDPRRNPDGLFPFIGFSL